MTELGKFIRRERELKALTLRGMAGRVKVSPAFLSKVETEDWKPGEDKLLKIAEILGCDSDLLMSLAGRIPSDIQEIIKRHPVRIAKLLREIDSLPSEEANAFLDTPMGEFKEMRKIKNNFDRTLKESGFLGG